MARLEPGHDALHPGVSAGNGAMYRFQPVLVLALRTIVGLLLSLALGMAGVGLGWILFVFFGGTSHTTLLALFMSGAAVGAASGGLLAWLRLDHNTLPLLIGTGAVLLLAGLAGAWGGFHFGSQQEGPCCASPEIGPITYIALGAVATSNGLALLLGVFQAVRQVNIHRRPAR